MSQIAQTVSQKIFVFAKTPAITHFVTAWRSSKYLAHLSASVRAFPRKLELSGVTCGFVVNYFCGTLT